MAYSTINNDVTMAGGEGTLLANRYRVVRQLGQGGMGCVWLAEDTQLDNKLFAIKMLPSILVSNKRAYRQLKDEALVAMQLVHPSIVQIRAFEENGGNPFLVMDYIDGQTLDDYLAEKGKLSEEEAIKLLKPIAVALDYAHTKGVVHRDVKPGNVMIANDGTPYILDFGIAREIQETMTRVTGKMSSGTLLYMSPEQLNGDAPTKEQDIYSFAAMAYECLKGEPPFTRGAIEDQIKNKMPAPLPEGACAALIMSGLAKNQEERPATCAAVLSSGGLDLRRRATTATSVRMDEPRNARSTRNTFARKEYKGGGIVLTLIGLLVVLMGGVWWGLTKHDGDSERSDSLVIEKKANNRNGNTHTGIDAVADAEKAASKVSAKKTSTNALSEANALPQKEVAERTPIINEKAHNEAPAEESGERHSQAIDDVFAEMGKQLTGDSPPALPPVDVKVNVSISKSAFLVDENVDLVLELDAAETTKFQQIIIAPTSLSTNDMVVCGEKSELLPDLASSNPSNVIRRIKVPIQFNRPFRGDIVFTVNGMAQCRVDAVMWGRSFSTNATLIGVEIRPKPSKDGLVDALANSKPETNVTARQPLVGRWEGKRTTQVDSYGKKFVGISKLDYEFFLDGTFKYSEELSSGSTCIKRKGSWTLNDSGDALSLRQTEFSVNGLAVPNQSLTSSYKIRWTDKDTLELRCINEPCSEVDIGNGVTKTVFDDDNGNSHVIIKGKKILWSQSKQEIITSPDLLKRAR